MKLFQEKIIGLPTIWNAHSMDAFIGELIEKVGIYPIGGVSWKWVDSEESGFRSIFGAGLYGNFGRIAPYTEYIYSAGFENEGIFLIGTFFTFGFKRER